MGEQDVRVLVIPGAAVGAGDEVSGLREEPFHEAQQRHGVFGIEGVDRFANAERVENCLQAR